MSLLSLCLFVCSLVCLTTGVNAASENLIDSNLMNWDPFDEGALTSIVSNADIYRFTVEPISSSVGFSSGIIYDISNVTAGHSCTLSFKLPTGSEIASAWGVDYNDTRLSNHYNNSTLTIGFGYLDGDRIDSVNELYTIDSNNLNSFLGKTVTASFVAQGGSGVPVVYIWALCNDVNTHHFFFKNFTLIDNDDNTAELQGIKGFLHSIRWDLVGGVCEEEDCPHSSVNNPHLSLSDRAKNAFNQFFTDLQLKINSLQTEINSGNVSIGGWFSDIGDKLSSNFTNNINTIKDNFSGLITDMKSSFTNLGNSISGFFDNLWNNFSSWLDKFKPRVYEELRWDYGYTCSMAQGKFWVSSTVVNNAAVTEYFNVPINYPYYLDYSDISASGYLAVMKYDLQKNFISFERLNNATEKHLLPSGYLYRFYYVSGGYYDFSVVDSTSDICNGIVKIYADEGWATAILHKLQSIVIGLFVPDENFIDNYKTDFDTLFAENLGLIYDASNFVSDVISEIETLLFDSQDKELQLTFPGVEFEIAGNDVTLFSSRTVDFTFLSNGIFATLYGIYKVFLYLVFGVALIQFGIHTWERTMSN